MPSSSHSTSTFPLSADSTSTNTDGKQYYRKVVLSDMGLSPPDSIVDLIQDTSVWNHSTKWGNKYEEIL